MILSEAGEFQFLNPTAKKLFKELGFENPVGNEAVFLRNENDVEKYSIKDLEHLADFDQHYTTVQMPNGKLKYFKISKQALIFQNA